MNKSIPLLAVFLLALSFTITISDSFAQETVSITTPISPITILFDEFISLLDTSVTGNLTSISVTANLPCDSSNNPLVTIVAGILGNTVNIIDSSSDFIGNGPRDTCVFRDNITNVTAANIPAINSIFLNHTGSSPVHIPQGVMVTLSGVFENSTSESYTCGVGHTDNGDGTCTFGYTTGTYQELKTSSDQASSCSNSKVKQSSSNTLKIRNSATTTGCHMTVQYWDISSIDDSAVINTVNLQADYSGASLTNGGSKYCDVRHVEGIVSTTSADDLWADILTGTLYFDGSTDGTSIDKFCLTASDDQIINLGSSAVSELQTELTDNDEFAIGVSYDSSDSRQSGVDYIMENAILLLEITYTP